MLGVFYAVLAAAAFGFNNASARRGVLTGTPIQGLAISMPIGVVFFFLGAVATGEWSQVSRLVWWDILMLSGAGFMHFVWGRYFNILSLAPGRKPDAAQDFGHTSDHLGPGGDL
jgi:hypothetical protein